MAFLSHRMTTGSDWRRVSRALENANKSIPDKIRVELRETADPLVRRAQRKVLSFPTYGPVHTGLRGRVASGVDSKVTRTGVLVTTSMNKKSEAGIPLGMDTSRGWRHPVFGNRSVWVTQHTGGDWFRSTMVEGKPEFERRIRDVLENAARTVDAAGSGR